jgi:LmbE family N-acetylglucosaminyl deacetylase
VIADRDVERALVVVAHPDDAEFWAGGTIAGWTDTGIEVTYCVLTDGGGGGFDPGVPRSEIPRMRRTEQQEAASMLGVREVRFLESAEGSLLDAPRGNPAMTPAPVRSREQGQLVAYFATRDHWRLRLDAACRARCGLRPYQY